MQANSDVKARSRPTFSREKLSIARLMMIVTLVAANLALMREVPWEIRSFPTIWFALGIVDYVILWKLILRRPFRAAHYTFLVVLVIAFIVLVNLAASGADSSHRHRWSAGTSGFQVTLGGTSC